MDDDRRRRYRRSRSRERRPRSRDVTPKKEKIDEDGDVSMEEPKKGKSSKWADEDGPGRKSEKQDDRDFSSPSNDSRAHSNKPRSRADLDRIESELKEKALRQKVVRTRRTSHGGEGSRAGASSS